MMRAERHPFGLQWDSDFYRDMARLQRIRTDNRLDDCVDDTTSIAKLYVRTLHTYFIEPIVDIEWHTGIVILRLRMPQEATGNVALYSFGHGHYKLSNAEGYDDVTCPQAELLIHTLVRDLTEYGSRMRNLPRRKKRGHIGSASKRKSRTSGTNATTKLKQERSATVSRTTVRYNGGMGDAYYDRANAEIPPAMDDARIVRFKLIEDAGVTTTINGLRQAISPTSRHSVKSGCATVEARAMNPNATIHIDPPDRFPMRPGHQVLLPEGEDTTITVTATAPDGVTKSSHQFTALRRGRDSQ